MCTLTLVRCLTSRVVLEVGSDILCYQDWSIKRSVGPQEIPLIWVNVYISLYLVLSSNNCEPLPLLLSSSCQTPTAVLLKGQCIHTNVIYKYELLIHNSKFYIGAIIHLMKPHSSSLRLRHSTSLTKSVHLLNNSTELVMTCTGQDWWVPVYVMHQERVKTYF